MYVEFEFYKDIYKGKLADNSNFPFFELKASRYVERLTLRKTNKAILDKRFENDIKICICELIDIYFEFDEEEKKGQALEQQLTENKIVSSESVGNHSVSFQKVASNSKSQLDKQKELDKLLYRIVYQNLATTNLLNRGINYVY